MAHIIIDRRQNDKGKSSVNRQRFVKRVRDQVREAVKDVIRDGDIKDIVGKEGKKIRIPGKGLGKPEFHHADTGGVSDKVYTGNDRFTQGDRIDRPPPGGGQGGGASPDGEGEDEFDFHLTREEFLDLFFEDLELPDLVKNSITKIDDYAWKRSGFSVDGNPSRLNVLRSMKQSKGRRIALRLPKKKKIKELEIELLEIVSQMLDFDNVDEKMKAVPFIDDTDLRYNRWDKVPLPTTQAVMFAIMDVSGSMGEWEKEMAKRFFMLLFLFLHRNYERVEIVFIRHHSIAKEVDEEEFFYSKESGGTLISPALELKKKIIDERFPPSEWNIFGCQCSDGDNWGEDNHAAVDLLTSKILPITQYYAYIEIDRRGGMDSDIWPAYEQVKAMTNNFEMAVVSDVSEIYPVFAGLFEKRERA
jgi:uncharacterized sporulation protein YeaH/YhbH (DUF444 family)